MRLQPVAECMDDHDVLPVALISLSESTERRETLRARSIPSAWVESYWPATDLRNATLEHLRAVADLNEVSTRIGRMPHPGEIGCAAAHRSVARWLAESRYGMVLVLEDDAIPAGTQFEANVAAVADLLAHHARAGAAFICHLGPPSQQTRLALRRTVVRKARASSEVVPVKLWLHADPTYGLWRAHAYLLSKGAALRQVKLEPKIRTLADDWCHRRDIELLDEILFTQPIVFGQDEAVPSTIRAAGQDEYFCALDAETVLFSQRLWQSIRKGTFPGQALKSIRFRSVRALARMRSTLPYEVE